MPHLSRAIRILSPATLADDSIIGKGAASCGPGTIAGPIPTVQFFTALIVIGLLASCGGGASPAGNGAPAGTPSGQSTSTPPPTAQMGTIVITISGGGSVDSTPSGINCTQNSGCTQAFPAGSAVVLTATPSTSQTFLGWTGACTGSALSCQVAVNATENIGANFGPAASTDSLQVSVGGSGKVISTPVGISCIGGATGCSQTFPNGTSVTLTATPGSGDKFAGWSGSCSGIANTCTLTLGTASLAVGASFSPIAAFFALQVASNGNGNVTSSPAGISCNGTMGCSQSFASGTPVTLTAAANSGYSFTGWSGACSGSASSCALVMTSALSVAATFVANPPASAAAHFLVSDPYPLTVPQPSYFLVSCDGAASISSIPAVNPDGTSYLHFPVSSLPLGTHICTIAADNGANQQSGNVTVSFAL